MTEACISPPGPQSKVRDVRDDLRRPDLPRGPHLPSSQGPEEGDQYRPRHVNLHVLEGPTTGRPPRRVADS